MQMTFLDFFSGIGGFRAELEACGMKCIGHCEINNYADRSYRVIFDVKEDEWYANDITKVQPGDVPHARLLDSRLPMPGYFCLWLPARACRRAKRPLF